MRRRVAGGRVSKESSGRTSKERSSQGTSSTSGSGEENSGRVTEGISVSNSVSVSPPLSPLGEEGQHEAGIFAQLNERFHNYGDHHEDHHNYGDHKDDRRFHNYGDHHKMDDRRIIGSSRRPP